MEVKGLAGTGWDTQSSPKRKPFMRPKQGRETVFALCTPQLGASAVLRRLAVQARTCVIPYCDIGNCSPQCHPRHGHEPLSAVTVCLVICGSTSKEPRFFIKSCIDSATAANKREIKANIVATFLRRRRCNAMRCGQSVLASVPRCGVVVQGL